MRKILPFLLVLAFPVFAQVSNPSVKYVTVAPSGACAFNPPIQVVKSTGTTYTCKNGTWASSGGGGGSMTWPTTPGITVCTGTPCTAWGTSLAAPAGVIVGTTALDSGTLPANLISVTTPTIIPTPYTIAAGANQLPSSGLTTDQVYWVTDAQDLKDATVGGGSVHHGVRWNGGWVSTYVVQPVNLGGTGLATLTLHSLQIGEGTNPPNQMAVCGTGVPVVGVTGADPICSAGGALGTGAFATTYVLPSQYKTWTCETGLGDGLNAFTSDTYLQHFCVNKTGVTVTITGVSCYADAGSPTLNASGTTLGALLTGAVTCTTAAAGAAGTQSANVALTAGDAIDFTFVSGSTAKQTTWIVTGTY